jgi:ISXO2-like transposase domain
MVPFPSCDSLSTILYSEEACIQWLIDNRMLDAVAACGACGGEVVLSGKFYNCRSRSCRKRVSVFRNSFFALSKLPLTKVMQIGYYWLGGSGRDEIMRFTGISNKTSTSYIKYFRQLVSSSIETDDTMIGGDGVVVEVDESKFGKRKYHRGHRVEGVWVVGGVERTASRMMFAEVVQDRSATTLRDVLVRHVRSGTVILTDMWKGYSDLHSIGLTHDTVNHSIGFISPTGVHTNSIEGTWNGIKIGVPSRNRTFGDMPDFLLEFIWRRKNAGDLWGGLLNAFRTISYE